MISVISAFSAGQNISLQPSFNLHTSTGVNYYCIEINVFNEIENYGYK